MLKYQRRSIRIKEYDYSRVGGYFITICTHNRIMLLGPKDIQEIIQRIWRGIPIKFPEVKGDQFIIMPNHIHGIILIVGAVQELIVGAVHEPPKQDGAIHELPLQNRRRMLLPKIIGYFKMNSAKYVNQVTKTPNVPLWQRNYYEHVIRNESELNRTREYIINNPLKWQFDRENPDRAPNQQYEKEWEWLEG